jgi:tetratricopeptide (TPR) repeat protein
MATEEGAPDGEKARSAGTGSSEQAAGPAGEQNPADEQAAGPAGEHDTADEQAAGPAGEQNPADEQAAGPAGEKAAASEQAEPEAAESEQTMAGEQAAAGEKTPAELFAAGAEALIDAAFRTGDFGQARELLEKARDDAAAAGDRATEALAVERLGSLAHHENITKLVEGSKVPSEDADAEEKLFRQALAICQELGDQAGTARAAFGVGLVFQVLRDDWPTAMPYYWQALDLSSALEASGDYNARAEIHRHLGFYYHFEAASPGQAVQHLQLSLDLRQELGDPRLIPSALVALGQAELAAGNSERAVELLTRAVADARAAGLLPHRVKDAEQALREAQAAAPAAEA